MSLLIKRRTDVVDVFSGVGYNHSVFRLERGVPKLVSGEALSDSEYKELINTLRNNKG
jgi:hypothetical protein